MFTIIDLLEDPVYKEYFCTPPKKKSMSKNPWRVYIMTKPDRKWAYKDFPTYVAAFKFFKHHLKLGNVIDGAISSRGLSFDPPKRTVKLKGKYFINDEGIKQQVTKRTGWKPRLPGEEVGDFRWCVYCRRTSEFQYFTQHRVLNGLRAGGILPDPSVKRCSICAASERINSRA